MIVGRQKRIIEEGEDCVADLYITADAGRLEAFQEKGAFQKANSKALGIYKTPVAGGRGSGKFKYDIFPGHPEKSILVYRFNSTDIGIMMPELGRSMVHEEGLKLIEEWILSIKEN